MRGFLISSEYLRAILRLSSFHRSRCGSFASRSAACSSSRRLLRPPALLTCDFLSHPYCRSSRKRSAIAASLVVTAPPSPSAPRFFVGEKLKHPAVPKLPAFLPSRLAP